MRSHARNRQRKSVRPLPARPAGEEDRWLRRIADDLLHLRHEAAGVVACPRICASRRSSSPATQGRGGRLNLFGRCLASVSYLAFPAMSLFVDPIWTWPAVAIAAVGLIALVLATYPRRVRHLAPLRRRLLLGFRLGAAVAL